LVINDLRTVSKTTFISLLEEVEKEVYKNNYRRVGLLATPTTYSSGLYNFLNTDKVELFYPNDFIKKEIEQIIKNAISGKVSQSIKFRLNQIIKEFSFEKKLDVVILGCTELPLIYDRKINVKVISTLDILADSLLAYYYNY
jgi:aspartate racemase